MGRLSLLGLLIFLPVIGCKSRALMDLSCSSDKDCPKSSVCREAKCQSACVHGHWVGESVEVESGGKNRAGQIVNCEGLRFYVRYDNNIEEQVDVTRLKREQKPTKSTK